VLEHSALLPRLPRVVVACRWTSWAKQPYRLIGVSKDPGLTIKRRRILRAPANARPAPRPTFPESDVSNLRYLPRSVRRERVLKHVGARRICRHHEILGARIMVGRIVAYCWIPRRANGLVGIARICRIPVWEGQISGFELAQNMVLWRLFPQRTRHARAYWCVCERCDTEGGAVTSSTCCCCLKACLSGHSE